MSDYNTPLKPPPCKWCGATWNCTCEVKRTCEKRGETPLHNNCGMHPCGCPRFFHDPGGWGSIAAKEVPGDVADH